MLRCCASYTQLKQQHHGGIGQLDDVQDSLKAWVECLDAGIVVIGDAAGEDLAQHISVQVKRDIGSPCVSTIASYNP